MPRRGAQGSKRSTWPSFSTSVEAVVGSERMFAGNRGPPLRRHHGSSPNPPQFDGRGESDGRLKPRRFRPQNLHTIPAGSADAQASAAWHPRPMSRSSTTPEPPVSPDAGTDVLPDWLRSRDVSSVGHQNPSTQRDPTLTQHAFLTIPEVAARMRASPRTVSRWIASGTLDCVRIRRVVRVAADAVDLLTRSGKPS